MLDWFRIIVKFIFCKILVSSQEKITRYNISIKRLNQIFIAIILTIFAGILETASLTSIKSLFTILNFSSKESVPNDQITRLLNLIGITTQNNIWPIVLTFLAFIILSSLFRLSSFYWNTKLGYALGGDLCKKAFGKILNQNYLFHVENDSSKSIATLTTHARQFIALIGYSIQLISAIFIVICIFTVLLLEAPLIAIFTSLYLVLIYSISIIVFKKKLNNNSLIAEKCSAESVSIVQESIKGMRYIKFDSLEKEYENYFERCVRQLNQSLGDTKIISALPRYLIETPGLVLIVLLAIWQSYRNGDIYSTLPLLASVAFAYQRLLPLAQIIYSSFVFIKGSISSYFLLRDAINLKVNKKENFGKTTPIKLKNKIDLKGISFRYSKESNIILKNIDLYIRKGEKVGIIGPSGAGKSTLLDIISGLIKPQSGSIKIDNIDLNRLDDDDIKAWQSNIAYVPQSIFLSNNSILENIAFGSKKSNLDISKVKNCLDLVQLKDFVEKLPNKEKTIIGESGIKLSGGQRQRIALAKAIYSEKSLLILDEATNAIDTKLEKKILSSIYNSSKEKTIIFVAHRLESLKFCDRIILVKDSSIIQNMNINNLIKEHFEQ